MKITSSGVQRVTKLVGPAVVGAAVTIAVTAVSAKKDLSVTTPAIEVKASK